MSQTIKKISVTYDAVNPSNTFTNGDILHGRVTVEIAKDTKIDTLFIKFKGKAFVRWTERHGKTTHTNWDKEKYFTSVQYFISEQKDGFTSVLLKNEAGQPYCDVVAPGTHVYPFTFQIPQQTLPPSFKGAWGYVGYFLEAKLSRSMRFSNEDKVEIRYIPKPDMSDPELMKPQYGTKDKKMKLFTSGNVSFSIQTDRMGYSLGEGIKVVTEVQNSSSRALKPKYCLYFKHSFFSRHKRRLHTSEVLKEEGEPIEPSKVQTITKILTIPPTLTMSILNCRILKVEYRLKVYLDVPYASDPEIKFPIVILSVPLAREELPPSAPPVGFGAHWIPDQAEWNSAPHSAPPPPSYESYALYPPLPNYSQRP